MNRRLLILVVVSVLFLAGWTLQTKTVWEYKVVNSNKGTPPKELNELGAEGWELVTVRDPIFGGNSLNAEYIFKRPK
jgi:hypothetical protein